MKDKGDIYICQVRKRENQQSIILEIMIDNQVKLLLVPQVEYDSSVTTFGNLLEFFWKNHDPNSAKACSRSLSSFAWSLSAPPPSPPSWRRPSPPSLLSPSWRRPTSGSTCQPSSTTARSRGRKPKPLWQPGRRNLGRCIDHFVGYSNQVTIERPKSKDNLNFIHI